MSIEIVGFVVNRQPAKLGCLPEQISRIYTVKEAAEEFCKLYSRLKPREQVYVADVLKAVD